MPWTIKDVDQHNKGLTDAQKALWVKVANAALAKCEADGGSACDASAIKQANAVVAKNMSFDAWQKEYITAQTHNLKGVEIFAEGKWNGDNYTQTDLDAMVKAFDKVNFTPPLKLGHNVAQEADLVKDGQPALGWIDKLYRVGNKLLADFKEVPQKLYDAIKRQNYKTVSAEIYWNYTSQGVQYPRVLKAVALLGADIPAVTSLESIAGLYADGENTFKVYDTKTEEADMAEMKELTDKVAALEALNKEAEAKIAALSAEKESVVAKLSEQEAKARHAEAKAFVAERVKEGRLIPALAPEAEALLISASEAKVFSYASDMCPKCNGTGKLADGTKCPDCTNGKVTQNTVTLSQRATLERFFASTPKVIEFGEKGKEDSEAFSGDYDNAGVEVDKRAKYLMDAGKAKSYEDAVKSVLATDGDLKKKYTGGN